MPKNLESINIEQLLAEADELIQQINSDVINHMHEEHRLQFEKHARNLKKYQIRGSGQNREERNIGNKLQRRGYARGDPRYCEGHAGFEKHVFLNVIKKPLNKSRTLHQN